MFALHLQPGGSFSTLLKMEIRAAEDGGELRDPPALHALAAHSSGCPEPIHGFGHLQGWGTTAVGSTALKSNAHKASQQLTTKAHSTTATAPSKTFNSSALIPEQKTPFSHPPASDLGSQRAPHAVTWRSAAMPAAQPPPDRDRAAIRPAGISGTGRTAALPHRSVTGLQAGQGWALCPTAATAPHGHHRSAARAPSRGTGRSSTT